MQPAFKKISEGWNKSARISNLGLTTKVMKCDQYSGRAVLGVDRGGVNLTGQIASTGCRDKRCCCYLSPHQGSGIGNEGERESSKTWHTGCPINCSVRWWTALLFIRDRNLQDMKKVGLHLVSRVLFSTSRSLLVCAGGDVDAACISSCGDVTSVFSSASVSSAAVAAATARNCASTVSIPQWP